MFFKDNFCIFLILSIILAIECHKYVLKETAQSQKVQDEKAPPYIGPYKVHSMPLEKKTKLPNNRMKLQQPDQVQTKNVRNNPNAQLKMQPRQQAPDKRTHLQNIPNVPPDGYQVPQHFPNAYLTRPNVQTPKRRGRRFAGYRKPLNIQLGQHPQNMPPNMNHFPGPNGQFPYMGPNIQNPNIDPRQFTHVRPGVQNRNRRITRPPKNLKQMEPDEQLDEKLPDAESDKQIPYIGPYAHNPRHTRVRPDVQNRNRRITRPPKNLKQMEPDEQLDEPDAEPDVQADEYVQKPHRDPKQLTHDVQNRHRTRSPKHLKQTGPDGQLDEQFPNPEPDVKSNEHFPHVGHYAQNQNRYMVRSPKQFPQMGPDDQFDPQFGYWGPGQYAQFAGQFPNMGPNAQFNQFSDMGPNAQFNQFPNMGPNAQFNQFPNMGPNAQFNQFPNWGAYGHNPNFGQFMPMQNMEPIIEYTPWGPIQTGMKPVGVAHGKRLIRPRYIPGMRKYPFPHLIQERSTSMESGFEIPYHRPNPPHPVPGELFKAMNEDEPMEDGVRARRKRKRIPLLLPSEELNENAQLLHERPRRGGRPVMTNDADSPKLPIPTVPPRDVKSDNDDNKNDVND